MNQNEQPEQGTTVVGAAQPCEPAEKNMAAATASPVSSNDTEEGNVATRGDGTATVNDVMPETARDHNVEAATANETTKTEYTEEEEERARLLQMEIWQSVDDDYDFRYFRLPETALAHLLKYGSLGREIMRRGDLKNKFSVQVYFGYRRALVAEFCPVGLHDHYEYPAGAWELDEYRWRSEEGREVVRLLIDERVQRAENEYEAIYIDTFYNDVERLPPPSYL